MKDHESIAGQTTLELPGITRPRCKQKGERPMTNAERQRNFRSSRITINLGKTMTATIKHLADNFDITIDEVMQHLTRFALCNRNLDETGFPSRNALNQ